MCGICGKYNFLSGAPVDPAELRAMADVMIHRGPDDAGYHSAGPLGLGVRRLSIIDVAGGRQPIANEDESVWIAANGEIYNFPELRREMEGRGHRFRTRSDVETIVHLYEEYGTACVKRLRGMFAFALWDERARRLFLARDRVGKKPLFYAETKNGLVFGSSIRSLLQDPAVGRGVDLEALHHYLTWQYVPEPATMFAGVSKLPPAHTLVCENGAPRVERYWSLDFSAKSALAENEAAEAVRESLKEATRIRLMSEVPLGAFLSGGVDSTAVVGLMTELGARPVRTFSIGFEESGFDELSFARLAARRFETDHHELTVRADAVAVLPEIVRHFEEPMADMSAVPTYYLAKMTKAHVTVALNGDGGDEAFAGYVRYRVFQAARRLGLIPGPLRRGAGAAAARLPESERPRAVSRVVKRLTATLALDASDRYALWLTIFDAARKAALYSGDMAARFATLDSRDYLRRAFDRCPGVRGVDRLLCADTLTYLPGDLLVKMDRMTMAHSLEARSPFLDHHVLELAASLPPSYKLKGRTGKSILKKALAGLVPAEILGRAKMGFGVPVGGWFRRELKPMAYDVLLDARAAGRGYFRPEAVRALLDEHQGRCVDHGHRIWALLILELWHREFIDGPPAGSGA
jgi:asparagine synthase (glutamine-hydrolysing)